MTRAYRLRLKSINNAQEDLESTLLTLREHYKVTWTEPYFHSLYYLIRLARKATP